MSSQQEPRDYHAPTERTRSDERQGRPPSTQQPTVLDLGRVALLHGQRRDADQVALAEVAEVGLAAHSFGTTGAITMRIPPPMRSCLHFGQSALPVVFTIIGPYSQILQCPSTRPAPM